MLLLMLSVFDLINTQVQAYTYMHACDVKLCFYLPSFPAIKHAWSLTVDGKTVLIPGCVWMSSCHCLLRRITDCIGETREHSSGFMVKQGVGHPVETL